MASIDQVNLIVESIAAKGWPVVPDRKPNFKAGNMHFWKCMHGDGIEYYVYLDNLCIGRKADILIVLEETLYVAHSNAKNRACAFQVDKNPQTATEDINLIDRVKSLIAESAFEEVFLER